MTAADHGRGWPGHRDRGGAAPGDEVPWGAEPTGRTAATGLDPAFAAAGPGQPTAADYRHGGEPGDVTAPDGPDGLGWPAASLPPAPVIAGTVTARPGGSATASAGFGVGDLGLGEADVGRPVVSQPGSDTPID